MAKRSISPAVLPPSKRPHYDHDVREKHAPSLNFDTLLYDELILCIFSYLSWVDLCVIQSTNRNWARLAADNELWRELYLAEYGRTRLRGSRGFIGRLDGREVKPLPGHSRAKGDQYRDWKWMFRISSNWRSGRSLVEEWESPEHPDAGMPSPELPDEQTHILLAGPWTIAASSKKAVIQLSRHPGQSRLFNLPYEEPSIHSSCVSITALALDQSPSSSDRLCIAIFFSTGQFSVHDFNASSVSVDPIRRYNYRPSRQSLRTSNVVKAVYHHPLLVTLSENFSLSIYDLSAGTVRHIQTLGSFTSYPPASMVLSSPSSTAYKLVIAYSIPVYPKHWSIGATELLISKGVDGSASPAISNPTLFSSPSFHEDYKYPLATTMSILNSRTIRAFDTPSGWVDENSLRLMREQWGRKLYNVADAQTDGKWVVIAPGQRSHTHLTMPDSQTSSTSDMITSNYDSPTSLQLYRLVLPSQSNSISASPPKLNFVRTLHGQMSTVSALALADGRCVSLGQNGSIWVWDLEAGTGAQVAPADNSVEGRPIKGTVSFDDRRIVSAYGGKVVVRRFDI
ncbi:hypothetical protein D9613_000790 [Agrocybe pediades]|uniref:F-box domain-containing protein n=1 Tax=Agrocybe pediades TaxID=84607 RepID=A0A8H4VSI8_9AGAR|nr:hypothetical protein D9613_000790 [Agrocybe pediades]